MERLYSTILVFARTLATDKKCTAEEEIYNINRKKYPEIKEKIHNKQEYI